MGKEKEIKNFSDMADRAQELDAQGLSADEITDKIAEEISEQEGWE